MANKEVILITEMHDGGTWGYKVYSNGFYEQWGAVTATYGAGWGIIYVGLAKRMRDCNYTITHGHQHRNYQVNTYEHLTVYGRTPTGFYLNAYNYPNESCHFYYVCGFLAEGEY